MGYGTGAGINGIVIGGVAGFLELTLIVVALVVVTALIVNKFKRIR